MTSYSTIDEANEFFASRLHTEAWDEADPEDQQKALNDATRRINQLRYRDSKRENTQENEFPRACDTEVPQAIKDANCKIAYALLDGIDPEAEFEALMVTAQGTKDVRASYGRLDSQAHILAGIPSLDAWMDLLPFLQDPQEINLERV